MDDRALMFRFLEIAAENENNGEGEPLTAAFDRFYGKMSADFKASRECDAICHGINRMKEIIAQSRATITRNEISLLLEKTFNEGAVTISVHALESKEDIADQDEVQELPPFDYSIVKAARL